MCNLGRALTEGLLTGYGSSSFTEVKLKTTHNRETRTLSR